MSAALAPLAALYGAAAAVRAAAYRRGWLPRARTSRKAASTIASSPATVLPATQSGRSPVPSPISRPSSAGAGASPIASNFRLPSARTRPAGAPIRRARSAWGSDCIRNRSTSASTRLSRPRTAR